MSVPTTPERIATDAHAEEAALKNAAARLSIIAAAFLILIKTGTGWLTGSIAVWASLLDSAMDIFASSINYFAVRAAARPPDHDHNYGHGKAESLAGLFQAAVITISGLFLIYEGIQRLIRPQPTSLEPIGVATMLIAILVSIALVARLRRVAGLTDSPALSADAVHFASDVLTNGGVLLGLLLIYFTGWTIVDPLISIAISIYILASALSVGRESVDVLMDRRLPPEVDAQVAEIVSRFRSEGVHGFHDLRTRRSGSQKFIDLHLEVQRDQTLEEAHATSVRVLRTIEAEIPRAKVQIHTDPV
ncbi:MAG TPA: cation diffusion facilitator family transporter [Pyrinomonadaceae bacterium]|nr:cation diffusion facilitator family transporter [Pyrinomonadaceae bacterium]